MSLVLELTRQRVVEGSLPASPSCEVFFGCDLSRVRLVIRMLLWQELVPYEGKLVLFLEGAAGLLNNPGAKDIATYLAI